jgi:hypothetical protein
MKQSTGETPKAPDSSAKKRPSTAKKVPKEKDKEELKPWIPPMVSTAAKKDLNQMSIKSAVPVTELSRSYEQFSKYHEGWVTKTIQKDLDEEKEQEKMATLKSEQNMYQLEQQENARKDKETMSKMLELYFKP